MSEDIHHLALSDRLVGSVDATAWGMSKLIISDPQRPEDPAIAGKAKAEMMRFNDLMRIRSRTAAPVANSELGFRLRRSSPHSGTLTSAGHDNP